MGKKVFHCASKSQFPLLLKLIETQKRLRFFITSDYYYIFEIIFPIFFLSGGARYTAFADTICIYKATVLEELSDAAAR